MWQSLMASKIAVLLAGLVTGAGSSAYVGEGVTGLVAGGILTAIVGAIRNATSK